MALVSPQDTQSLWQLAVRGCSCGTSFAMQQQSHRACFSPAGFEVLSEEQRAAVSRLARTADNVVSLLQMDDS